MEDSKIVVSLKFLLSSVKKLSDTFIASEEKLTLSLKGVATDVDDLQERIEWLEKQLVDLSDSALVAARPLMTPTLPVHSDSEERVVPALNLSLEAILDAYASTPVLLEPFARPCSVNGRTLSGEIDGVELELFVQGTTWALAGLDGEWLLVPRPGTLERRTQLDSLERLYSIEGVKQFPALLHLIRPARAEAVVHGRRWQLKEKGVLSMTPDPLKANISGRLAELELRLARLEASSN
ncbi:hypothetical protein KQ302_09805 [Synechococcus sp. CS-602]|uniref:hypothetical protein n=1 Tax=Synechococcaceae TaxID=1890426 RepID=UPI0008FF2C4E|nr:MULTISPECIES: hypothetical protein [Synechococcaceae]MCT4365211.1 hypothetical protein [Candidatus Regnicoccus frigidus MAG-AL1]APD48575.1 hypothetical protein BM449_10475 [Synechococcus sp. SynAce01]MCT0205388.1 hypothetical protein [Synechococcus sp. CS-602]MCT0246882.1 hypothetical protein [Synechococcus sp. CS-601]MCT4367320.1 hypothetical protein [Candidatus Regnicoccus frigidus MAG-AL2]